MRKELVAIPGVVPSKTLSRAVRFGNLLFIAGSTGKDLQTKELVGDDIQSQTRQALENIRLILQSAGASLDDVLRTTCYLADLADKPAFDEVYVSFFPTNPPVRACFEVSRLDPGEKVEIEATAGIPG